MQTNLDARFADAIHPWVRDLEIIAAKQIEDHTAIVVAGGGDGFTIIRAFTLGLGNMPNARVEISADKQDVDADEALAHLVEGWGI